MPGSFADSNILLYLISADGRKRGIVQALLEQATVISVQVLNEIANVGRRKYSLAWSDIDSFIDELLPLLEVVPLTLDIHRSGRAIAARYGFDVYDSFIVAAAISAKCSTLFTEDLHHGQTIGGLTILNPFH